MSNSRSVSSLPNIGPKIAQRLHEIGVRTEDQLRKLGAAEAYRRIKQNYPNETLPVCYYLYSFEAALEDKHWNDLSASRKNRLRKQIDFVGE